MKNKLVALTNKTSKKTRFYIMGALYNLFFGNEKDIPSVGNIHISRKSGHRGHGDLLTEMRSHDARRLVKSSEFRDFLSKLFQENLLKLGYSTVEIVDFPVTQKYSPSEGIIAISVDKLLQIKEKGGFNHFINVVKEAAINNNGNGFFLGTKHEETYGQYSTSDFTRSQAILYIITQAKSESL